MSSGTSASGARRSCPERRHPALRPVAYDKDTYSLRHINGLEPERHEKRNSRLLCLFHHFLRPIFQVFAADKNRRSLQGYCGCILQVLRAAYPGCELYRDETQLSAMPHLSVM